MSAPVAVGLARTDRPRAYWWNGEGPLVSITTAMRAMDKPAIVNWAKKITAEAAVRNLDLIHRTIELGGDQAGIDFLKKLADHKRDKAADLGSRVHVLAEAIAREQAIEIADEERPFVEAYQRWLHDWQPKFIAAEYMVCSLKHRYGGTGDLVVAAAGTSWRLDIKTTEVGPAGYKGPYSDTALQLAAAHYAEFSGRPGDPKKYKVPPAEKCGVLALRGDGTYALVPYEITPDTFEAFLAARRLWDWMQGPAKSVVGQPVQRMEAVA